MLDVGNLISSVINKKVIANTKNNSIKQICARNKFYTKKNCQLYYFIEK